MPNFITTPNMSLPIPTVGIDTGPDYAFNLNACLTILDQHNHSAGSGIQINPSGLDINSDLPFQNNNLTGIRSARFQAQPAALGLPTDLGCVYVAGVDLFYNDINGNQIQLTLGGSIVGTAGSITGLPSGTASASFSSGTFTWQRATNTPAVMDFGSAILRNNVASSKGLTLSPPNAMGADYSLVLPSLPVSTSVLSLDSSGNIQANQSGVVTDANIANKTITAASIADGTITRTQEAAVGQQISSNSGSFSTTSASFVDVTNLTVTITTIGRPVMVLFQGDASLFMSNPRSNVSIQGTGINATPNFVWQILDGSTVINGGTIGAGEFVDNGTILLPPSTFNVIDAASAATHTYKLQVRMGGAGTLNFSHIVMVAYEL